MYCSTRPTPGMLMRAPESSAFGRVLVMMSRIFLARAFVTPFLRDGSYPSQEPVCGVCFLCLQNLSYCAKFNLLLTGNTRTQVYKSMAELCTSWCLLARSASWHRCKIDCFLTGVEEQLLSRPRKRVVASFTNPTVPEIQPLAQSKFF